MHLEDFERFFGRFKEVERMKSKRFRLVSAALLVVVLAFTLSSCSKKNKEVILATTTSTQDSGLLDVLIPIFEKKTGYTVSQSL